MARHPLHRPDHPRACGANRIWTVSLYVSCGSSPRVRGKLQMVERMFEVGRIIPARAGQTTAGLTARNTGTDHPRACGANNLSIWTPWPATGSSPRVRGKQRDVGQVAANHRIIPARAGQTLVQKSMTSCNADHPRACGANAQVRFEGGIDHGSSPRVRGKLGRGRRARRCCRIIPARAGQTPTRPSHG